MHKNSYQIVLTQDEISVMLLLAGNVMGCPSKSPRKHCDVIYEKIKQIIGKTAYEIPERDLLKADTIFSNYPATKTPHQLKIEELEKTIKEAEKQLEELKGL